QHADQLGDGTVRAALRGRRMAGDVAPLAVLVADAELHREIADLAPDEPLAHVDGLFALVGMNLLEEPRPEGRRCGNLPRPVAQDLAEPLVEIRLRAVRHVVLENAGAGGLQGHGEAPLLLRLLGFGFAALAPGFRFRELPLDGGVQAPEVSFQDVDRKSTRLNSSHVKISYAVFCLKKKKK